MAVSPAVEDALAELARHVGGDLRTDRASRILYSTDASIYQVEPYGVLLPRSADEVAAAVEIAARRRLPLLFRGSGTSLAGQAVGEALVVDVSRHLDRVLAVDPEGRRVTVEPGVVLDDLNRRLAAHGLQFGPDPASSDRATVGGMVSNNATGAHSILYGMTADHVHSVDVVLADGSTARLGPVEAAEVSRRAQRSGVEGRLYREIGGLVGEAASRRTIRAGTPRHWRRAGGYNLDRFVDGPAHRWPERDRRFNLAALVAGGEGTLAAITSVTLGLVARPERTALAVVEFADHGEALAAVPTLLECAPSAIELVDALTLELCRAAPIYARRLARFLDGAPTCLLVVEFQGASDAAVRARVEELARLRSRFAPGSTGVTALLDRARQDDVWAVRKAGLGLLMSLKGDAKPIPFIEDAAVPVEHLAEYVGELERFAADLGTRVTYYAHASAGCVHVRPLVDLKRASEVAKLPELAKHSLELVAGYGGALSSEHGAGRSRSWLAERLFGPDLVRLQRRVKTAFDPENLFNPGNLVHPLPEREPATSERRRRADGERTEAGGDRGATMGLGMTGSAVAGSSMTGNLRLGPDYRAASPPTRLDWSEEHGFDRAVEMCNGSGVCRKLDAGTMCPSFMVTREEEHSTRGRANLLRAALDGRLPAEALAGDRVHQALDLCVECKACRSECPSSVDMARIKIEVLAAHRARHGLPLRARLFSGLPRTSRWLAGRAAPAANALLGLTAVRKALSSILGTAPERPLPPFARRPFRRWHARHAPRPDRRLGRVALFVDTFNDRLHPRVARAAARLLAAAGWETVVPGRACCGRTELSAGRIERARAAARRTVEQLSPFAADGLPIVGLEPSCLLTLRDEYRYLLPDEPLVAEVAARAVTLEEFLDREAAVGGLDLAFDPTPRRVLLHGHCHQKALVGTGPARRILALPPGWTVEEVDSGCCGMAGAFGYEREHYDLSMAMAERRLLPAVRAEAAETLIVAAGTSCRAQIEHGSGRRALHPAEALAAALAPPG